MESDEGAVYFKVDRGSLQFSGWLFEGCKYYAEVSGKSEPSEACIYANISSLMLCVSWVEAKLNELIRYKGGIAQSTNAGERWKELSDRMKILSTKEKWNKISGLVEGHPKWDTGIDPYQSYVRLAQARNELVHYKSENLVWGNAPNTKIEKLIETLDAADDDSPSWVQKLLKSPDLGAIVLATMNDFDSILRTAHPSPSS